MSQHPSPVLLMNIIFMHSVYLPLLPKHIWIFSKIIYLSLLLYWYRLRIFRLFKGRAISLSTVSLISLACILLHGYICIEKNSFQDLIQVDCMAILANLAASLILNFAIFKNAGSGFYKHQQMLFSHTQEVKTDFLRFITC